MKLNIKKLASALVGATVLVSFYAGAVGKCVDCSITGIQPDPRRGGTYLFLDGDWSESQTSCSNTSSVHAFFVPFGSTGENSVLSTGLAAFLSDKTVGWIYGSGDCDAYGYETVDYIYIKKN